MTWYEWQVLGSRDCDHCSPVSDDISVDKGQMVGITYLKKIGDNKMYLVGFRPTITNEK